MENNEILIETKDKKFEKIRFTNITDSDRINKVVIETRDELFGILTDTKTELEKIKEMINDILIGKLDYE